MLAIIPARGGSKGLPGKNIKPLCGKPLIQYTIEAAKKSKYIDEVVVTTDDEKIASVSKAAGARVPFLRPLNLATDTSSAVDVYIHAVEFMAEYYQKPIDKFMVLLPTAPLRNAKHINEAYELFVAQRANTLISVRESDIPPSWFLTLDRNGRIANAGFGMKDGVISNRQTNRKYYIPNGAIYILDYGLLKNERTYYSDNTVSYIMETKDSVDIDTIDDFMYAEYKLSNNNSY